MKFEVMQLKVMKLKKAFSLFFVLPLLAFTCSHSLPATASQPQQIPQDAKPYFQKGVQALKVHQTAKAIQALSEAATIAPLNGTIHWELGWAYWQDQNWDQTVIHWELTKKYLPKQKGLQKYLSLAKEYQTMQVQKGTYQPPSSWAGSQKGELKITAVGDIMMGSDFKGEDRLPEFDGVLLFSGTKEHLQGDIVFGNLEGPLTKHSKSTKCKPGSKCYAFRTPPEYAANLKNAGFNLMNLANNHSTDFGHQGLKETLKSLQIANIASFGILAKPSIHFQVNGFKVAVIGVAAVSCCIHVDQIQKMKDKVRKLKKSADLVIVSFHAGAEGLQADHVTGEQEIYYGESRGNVQKFSKAMIDSGADLLLGHGPHTLRGMELYKGKAIIYSMGNFLGFLGFNTSGHLKYSMILQATISKQGDLQEIKVVPLLLSPKVIPSVDSKGGSIKLINRLSKADFGENALMLDESGVWTP